MVSDPQVHPSGKWIAYRITEADRESDGYLSSIWLLSLEEHQSVRLTRSGKTNVHPRWSPDGDLLAFTSDRGGTNQIWVLPFARGGEAYQVTKDLKGLSSAAIWNPDGTQIAVTALGAATPGEALAEPSEIKHSTRLFHKLDGAGVLGAYRQHVYITSADGSDEPRQVTSGEYDHGAPSWSPDSKRLALISRRSEDADINPIADLYILDIESGEYRMLCGGFNGLWPSSAQWSACGTRLLVASGRGPTWDHHTPGIWAIDVATGELSDLSGHLDRPFTPADAGDISAFDNRSTPVWSADGKKVITMLGSEGQCEIHEIECKTLATTCITGGKNRNVTAFSAAADGTLAYTVSDPGRAPEVYYKKPGCEETRGTDVNACYFAETAMRPTEELNYTASDGLSVQAWVIRPEGEGPFPLVLHIHGGPHGAFGAAYHHAYQCLAAKGYAVLYTNPRGSQSYGTEFARGCIKDWGGMDYKDIMAAVELLVEQGIADPERLCVTGYSYGGFMTNWIITHTNRFRAAVSGGCVSNLHSFYGSADIGYGFMEAEIGGPPWESIDELLRHSPLMYAANVTTPTLFLHGERDDRCPIDQAEQMYVALKRMGKPAELVRYPNSSHLFILTGKPSYRVDYLDRSLRWFEAHTKN